MNLAELGGFLFDQPLMTLTIIAILLAVGAGMLAATRPRLGQAMRNAGYLGLVAALLLTVAQLAGHNSRSDAALLLDRTRPAEIVGSETVIAMRADGHFWVEAQLNGTPVEFLIDTGATYTGVSRRVAERVGLRPDANDAGVILETANGPIVARMAEADSLRFGGIQANALPVAIGPDGEVDTNVIGMNLLSRLGAWRVEENRLILVPRQG
ncbi:TIGR02281 family clan AA aspartic protease [Novosphingobium sp. AP12]|uniref:retropepsin-like aspartic protease family protein n=1 Tax=Novosphingobium sp. AP12 TaxID=1144305 RepID=UPI000271E6BD|nr:TIGR02281 family clan AA aspartic protease [Novosphingobium sp. AP12]EJL35242.1 clan AA aspartic protease, TIGR02281 family [Novosphingobium sp. AP12]